MQFDENTTLAERFPRRATNWRLRTKTLHFGRMPAVMGIVNVTPDSFSDGGRFADRQRAVEHGLRLVSEGADILDIGGESTRPYATPVELGEELDRVVNVVTSLAAQTEAVISIDTSKAKVAEEAIQAGAEIINDVTALQGDRGMLEVAAAHRPGICAMHMQGTPQTMQDNPMYGHVVEEVTDYLKQRRNALMAAGIEATRICLDPGIGFGKTHQHNLTLLARVGEFHSLGAPLLVGHSRKGFLAKILGSKTADRTLASVGVSLRLAAAGVQIIRVHDVLPTVQALSAFVAAGGVDGHELQLKKEG